METGINLILVLDQTSTRHRIFSIQEVPSFLSSLPTLADDNHHDQEKMNFPKFPYGQMKNEKRILLQHELPRRSEISTSREMEKLSGRNLSELPIIYLRRRQKKMIKGGTTGQEFIMIRVSSACPSAAYAPDHQSNLASSVVGCAKVLRQQTGFPRPLSDINQMKTTVSGRCRR